jgi:signal transduction histidine kinase
LGSQILAYILILTVGSQFIFLQDATERALSIITLIISLSIAILFLQNSNKETKTRKKVEQLADELNLSNERLKDLDKQKSEFISIASHQLRTPLTAIKGYVSLLLEGSYGEIKPDIKDVLNKVYSVNDRLVHLVEDLLNVSRIEAGRIQYNFQPTQLADILTELHDMFGMTAKNKGLEFNLNLPEPKLPKIVADPNKIKEISSNLIDNAIKYTPSGSVTVTLSQEGPNARIVIADTGIGIKPEDKGHLFTKFVRSKETSRMVVGGAGLGLFVGKSFVMAHKGTIRAESEGEGKGSQFIIELPIINAGLQVGTMDKQQEA